MTRDSNRRILGISFAVALALGCARSPSTNPLSAASPTDGADGPSSDRRAKAEPPPAPPAAAPVSSANPAPSAASSAQPQPPGEVSKKEEEVSGASGAARVELLDAGKEPRRKLRFTFHAKETLKVRFRNEMSMEMTIKDKTTRQRLPAMELEGTIETLSVDAQGSARRRSTYSSLRWLSTPGVTPELQKRMEKQLDGFAGITVLELMSSRGESLEQEIDWSSVKNPELKTTVESMAASLSHGTVGFPEEAVGVGARWRAQRVTKTRDLTLAYDTTTRLTSLKGDRLEAEFTGKVSGGSAGSGANAEVVVERNDTTMSGQQRVTLDPMSIEANTTAESVTVTRAKDLRVNVRTSMRFSVSIRK